MGDPGVGHVLDPAVGQIDGEQSPFVRTDPRGDEGVGHGPGERAPGLPPVEDPSVRRVLVRLEPDAWSLGSPHPPARPGVDLLSGLGQDRQGVEMGFEHPRDSEALRGNGRQQLPATDGPAITRVRYGGTDRDCPVEHRVDVGTCKVVNRLGDLDEILAPTRG